MLNTSDQKMTLAIFFENLVVKKVQVPISKLAISCIVVAYEWPQ